MGRKIEALGSHGSRLGCSARADEDEQAAAAELAEQLYRAGWRPGMIAEEAARSLAEDR